jgi:hypothetical protein
VTADNRPILEAQAGRFYRFSLARSAADSQVRTSRGISEKRVQAVSHRAPGISPLRADSPEGICNALVYLKGKKSIQQMQLISAETTRRCFDETARYDERCWSILHPEQRRKLEEIMNDARQRADAATQPPMIDD